jgi:general secretion pathway protein G
MKNSTEHDRFVMYPWRDHEAMRARPIRGRLAGTFLATEGFSLIEVMIVVVILAILATLLAPHVMGRTDDAKRAAAKAQIKNIESALQLYKLDNGIYPSNEQGLKALVEKPSSEPRPANWKAGGYLAKLPSDPWGRVYAYATPGKQGEFEIVSLGADGTPGGEGKNADLANWDLERN